MNERPADDDRREADKNLADDLAGAWFDGLALDDSASLVAGLDEQGARRLADLQFLHVLLEELHHSSSSINAERVQRALAGTEMVAETPNDPPMPARIERKFIERRGWLITSAAAAAAVLVGAGVWLWSTGSTRAAHAAVLRVAQHSRALHDRQYHVIIELNHAHGEQSRMHSTLYLRGGEKYSLRHPGALGEVWVGSNGRQGWLVPSIGPVITNDNPRYPARWSQAQNTPIPNLQLADLLDLMAERFSLSLLPSERLPSRPDHACQRISGRCNIRDEIRGGGPQQIELWAHPVTGAAERIVLVWLLSPDEVGRTRIEVELLSEDPVDDSWYEAETHRRDRSKAPSLTAPPSGSSG